MRKSAFKCLAETTHWHLFFQYDIATWLFGFRWTVPRYPDKSDPLGSDRYDTHLYLGPVCLIVCYSAKGHPDPSLNENF